MDFPVYRKYTNNASYFIILSDAEWTEYKKIGSRYVRFEMKAIQFPEKLFIKDLIEKTEGVAETTPSEIEALPK